MRIRFRMDAVESAIQFLAGYRQRIGNPKDLMNGIAILMRRSFAENFNVGGRPAWAPLSPRTIAEKERLFEAGVIRGRRRGVRVRVPRGQVNAGALPGILIRYGRMKDAVARRGVQGNVHRVSADGRTLEIGVGEIFVPERGRKVGYPSVHQRGDPSRRIPARPFLVIQDEDMEAIRRLEQVWLQGGDIRAHLRGADESE